MLTDSKGANACTLLAVLLFLSSAGCVDRWTEARVRDPALIRVSVTEHEADASVPGGALALRRDPSGGLSLSAPELTHFDAETLIDPSGSVRVRPPVATRAVYLVRDGELQVSADYPGRYAFGSRGRVGYLFDDSFHVDLRTPMSNVDRVDLHRRPSRAAGDFLLAGAAVLGGMALTAFEGRSPSGRSIAPAAFLGASIAFAATGAVFCFSPDLTRQVVP
jgi:hypothetical protein